MSSSSSLSVGVAVDAVIFTLREGELQALLIQIEDGPYAKRWAFPGGMLQMNETTREAAQRILEEQTGLKQSYLEQLSTFDDVKRDIKRRVVSVAYFALIPNAEKTLQTTKKYLDVRWWPVRKLPQLAYDHSEMAKVALERLRGKLSYTNIVWSLLPAEFTLTELQQTYEHILEKTLDKRNFRKKILSLSLLQPTGKKRAAGYRPAELYKFKKRSLEIVGML
jgi:8-oxo-dGTP diphosphatase